MGIFSEGLDVACTPDGQPVRLEWRDVAYVVCAEPVRWFERRQWWAEDARAPLGQGQGIVDHEIWRLQVLPEQAAPAKNPAAASHRSRGHSLEYAGPDANDSDAPDHGESGFGDMEDGYPDHDDSPAHGDSAALDILTFDLSRHAGSGRWRMVRIHDALRVQGS